MKRKYLKRCLCLLLTFVLLFSVTVSADDTTPEDFEDDNTTTTIDFSEPSDTTIDDTVWTREYDDGTEEIVTYEDLNPSPYLRWNAISTVGMSLDFKTGGKAVFATTVTTRSTSYSMKIVTKLQSYRSGTWKTLYTKTKTSSSTGAMNSGSYYVTKGYKYRTRNTITIYNSSGKVIETDTLNCTRTYN
ncbi:hypothetical protein BHF69_12950 [Anaerostipes sp. 992a]|uniref:hypothetical protein n=1 Tax=Anaerostipes sp. 992a TaxID=1261637 RepID=UPI0009524400|nr:hypothetical protein [Anaerostipes sp. 992a]OLR58146.1 hypothetical protein BHF69_12950 [Anaerostipes sp. 992a]